MTEKGVHMKAVILAGGEGTRLKNISGDLPKPMVSVLGKPILEYIIENLKNNGFDDIYLMTGFRGEKIREYFGDGSRLGVKLNYYREPYQMGTAGALYYLRDEIKEDFVLTMGDLMLSVDFERFMSFHKSCGGKVTLFLHPNTHPYDSDIMLTENVGRPEDFTEDKCGIGVSDDVFFGSAGAVAQENENAAASAQTGSPAGKAQIANAATAAQPGKRVTGIIGKKEERTGFYFNQVNSGVYAFSPDIFDLIGKPAEAEDYEKSIAEAEKSGMDAEGLKKLKKSYKTDLDKDIIRPLISKGEVFSYRSTEYVKDMGTPERYEEVSADLKSGLIAARNLKNRQKCIFLDRDGTINRTADFISSAGRLELLDRTAEAIHMINRSEYLTIVITNQPVIARGGCSFRELSEINAKLETMLGEKGAYIDDLYYCPHHKDKGFDGEVPELKFVCRCRKPAPGLIEKAAAEHNIDLEGSYMIGDMTQDIACGKNAGVKTVLVKTGIAGTDGKYDVKADAEAADLYDAVSMILGKQIS